MVQIAKFSSLALCFCYVFYWEAVHIYRDYFKIVSGVVFVLLLGVLSFIGGVLTWGIFFGLVAAFFMASPPSSPVGGFLTPGSSHSSTLLLTT